MPYFEKLLPHNAQMALLYAEAAEATGSTKYLETARKTSDFLCHELWNAEEGLFWSGLSADKDYYGWTSQELIQCVPREHVQAIALRFHLTPHPSKHVLYAALEPSEMYLYTYETEEVLGSEFASPPNTCSRPGGGAWRRWLCAGLLPPGMLWP